MTPSYVTSPSFRRTSRLAYFATSAAAGRCVEATGDNHQCRFTRAGLSHDRHKLALVNRHVDAVQYRRPNLALK